MIVGVGVDVIEVERVRQVIARHGHRFLRHVFCSAEQEQAPLGEAGRAAYYAGRWAAKEAVAKTLGTGIGENCGWKDIRIERGAGGRPAVSLHGRAAETAASLKIERIHISISHEKRLSCASAVAERESR
jgi:holo-[acyl-carrier protein] synthase